jgi:two-component system CheB/CheR fusion protein
MTAEEVEDERFLGLNLGLPLEELGPLVRACLDHESAREEAVLDATDRRGKRFQCRVTLLPLGGSDDGRAGAIVMMEPVVVMMEPVDG